MYKEDKEFSVTERKHPCLWRWRRDVTNAENNGGFSEAKKQQAHNWNVCAIGEASKIYPIYEGQDEKERFGTFGPRNSDLNILGMNFMDAVDNDEFDECRLILEQIENYLAEFYS